MREIADGVWQLRGTPRDMVNVYLAGDVLIDSASRWAQGRILRQLQGRTLRLVALTHVHPDHQGCAHVVCTRYGVPLACHEVDVPAMEGQALMLPQNRLVRFGIWLWHGPPHPVGRALREGDEVHGLRVVHAPGHTAGHVIYFRQADRVAFVGDVLVNMNFITRRPGLREPPHKFSVDYLENRKSVRKLLELKPRVICFGHGPPLYDVSLLESFVQRRGW